MAYQASTGPEDGSFIILPLIPLVTIERLFSSFLEVRYSSSKSQDINTRRHGQLDHEISVARLGDLVYINVPPCHETGTLRHLNVPSTITVVHFLSGSHSSGFIITA